MLQSLFVAGQQAHPRGQPGLVYRHVALEFDRQHAHEQRHFGGLQRIQRRCRVRRMHLAQHLDDVLRPALLEQFADFGHEERIAHGSSGRRMLASGQRRSSSRAARKVLVVAGTSCVVSSAHNEWIEMRSGARRCHGRSAKAATIAAKRMLDRWGRLRYRAAPLSRQRPSGIQNALGRGVAQLGRALRSGRKGRRFESSRPDQFSCREERGLSAA